MCFCCYISYPCCFNCYINPFTSIIIDLTKAVFYYSKKGIIQFRDPNNLDSILYTHYVALARPVQPCQVSPSVLLFVSGPVARSEICWLDCSTIPPKQKSQKKIIFPAAIKFQDMCFVSGKQMNRKRLLIVTSVGPEGIHAYNVDTKSLDWIKEIEGLELARVSSDGHGHLFVCDRGNECIHMISVLDGQYLRCFIKTGEQGLGRPGFAAWSEETSSLIVAHGKGNKRFISVFKVQ